MVQNTSKPALADGGEMAKALVGQGFRVSSFWGGFKVCHNSQAGVAGLPWGFPSVDVVFFEVGQPKHTQTTYHMREGEDYTFESLDLFPAAPANLEGVQVVVPADHVAATKVLYEPDFMVTCRSRTWDLELEKGHQRTVVSCSELAATHSMRRDWLVAIGAPLTSPTPAPEPAASDSSTSVVVSNDVLFRDVWTSAMKDIALETLGTVFAVLAAQEITSVLGGKSLLGFARNGTVLEWEQELQVMVQRTAEAELEDGGRVRQELAKLGLRVTAFWGGFKVCHDSLAGVAGLAWGFPSVDVVFFNEGQPTPAQCEYTGYAFERTDILPAVQAVLEGVPVAVPANADAATKVLYGAEYLTQCESRVWDGQTETAHTSTKVDCAQLAATHTLRPEWLAAIAPTDPAVA
jgi:hypothetical protein